MVASGPIEVLHVDDDPDITELTATFLHRENEQFDVQTATSATEGLTAIAQNGFDCIVSDYEMPGQDGIEFLQAVHETDPELPFILYTGKGSEEVASKAISAGVTDYLEKETGTSQYEVLANRIMNAVSQFQTRRELDRSQDLLQHTEQLADVGGWEADVETGQQRWTKGTYEIHDIDPDSGFDPTVDAGVGFCHPDDQDEIDPLIERCMERGEPYDIELRLITAKDQLRWVRATGEPVRKDGDIVTIRGAIRDITERKKRERVLSEEKEKHSTLVEESHDGILVLQDEEIKFANEQAESILGFEESEFLGKSMLEIVAPQDRERLQDRYQRRLDPETESPPAQYDMQFVTKDGEQRHANISTAKIQFDGEPADLVTFRDITEHKEREQRIENLKERLELAIDGAGLGVWDWDMTTDEVEFNEQWVQMLGYSLDEIEPHLDAWEKRVHPDDVEDVEAALDAHIAGETDYYDTEHRMRTADGDWKWIRDVGEIFERDADGKPVRAVGIHIDIDERKQHEQKLEDQRDNLEVLNQVVRHDIRNDMAVVSGRADLLEEHVEEAGKEDLEAIQDSVESATGLTKTARDLSDIMLSTEEDVEPIRLDQYLNPVIETARAKFETAVITTEEQIPETHVRGNELLEAVFRNLLQNAVVHNDKQNPEVRISTRIDEETTTVRVADNGPGIPDTQKETIFGKGQQGLDSPGTGLGLYLVRTLVEQYGGAVWVEDTDPEGSVFVVDLPLTETAATD